MRNELGPAVAAALLALLSVGAAPPALAAGKQIDAGKLFTRLDAYQKLPPAERSHFTMAYYLHIGPQPLTAPMVLVEGATRTPIPLRADGKVLKLPTPAQLEKAKVEIGVDEATKIGETIGLEPLTPAAADLDARELAAAIAQAGPGMKKIAGVFGLALPTPKAVLFQGVASGEAELADGRRVPLPLVKGAPSYDPAVTPNARRIRLPGVPRKLDID
ncbi:MAG: hypothetical protein ACJ798_13610 [Phenylobacterium sp.]